MFKLYTYNQNHRIEVIPEGDMYTVKELGDYDFEYFGQITTNFGEIIFIEDNPIEKKWYDYSDQKLIGTKNKYFQDFFGFTALNINGEIFKMNILIEKLKLTEIEDILMFLWQSENKIFENFFSKSSLKSKVDKLGNEFGLTSKFLVFANYFHDSFKSLLHNFRESPHTLLRKKIHEVDYSHNAVTSHSVDWLMTNLDNLVLDNSFQYSNDAISINNSYGILNRLETELNYTSYNVYENQLIIGSITQMIYRLAKLKKDISLNVNMKSFGNSEYADFRDLKRIPFIKLFEDSTNIESKLKSLLNKYKIVFKETTPLSSKPIITPVFHNKIHYRRAYKLIKDSRNLKFNLDGELQLLNIRRLSQLYEAYNLHSIIDIFTRSLRMEFFNINIENNRNDKMISKMSFTNPLVKINLYYEPNYPNSTNLLRIDNRYGSYYRPDYLIEIETSDDIKHYIFDSKYSKFHTIKNNLLQECIFKYILNTGIKNFPNKKIDFLGLIYPGDINDDIIKNENYSPQIQIIPSKPKTEMYLENVLMNLLKKNVPNSLIKEHV